MSTMTPEALTQRRTALANANVVRSARAQIKRDLKAGDVNIEAVITDPPAALTTAEVYEILLCVPKLGKVRANWMLTAAGITQGGTLGGISDRQRYALLTAMMR